MEAFDQKGRLKEDRLLSLEMAQSKYETAWQDALGNQKMNTDVELAACRQLVAALQSRIEEHEASLGVLTEKLTKSLVVSVSEQVTDTLQRSIMP